MIKSGHDRGLSSGLNRLQTSGISPTTGYKKEPTAMKPTTIRVVFYCAAEYKGESLNKNLLQGPDLRNTGGMTGE